MAALRSSDPVHIVAIAQRKEVFSERIVATNSILTLSLLEKKKYLLEPSSHTLAFLCIWQFFTWWCPQINNSDVQARKLVISATIFGSPGQTSFGAVHMAESDSIVIENCKEVARYEEFIVELESGMRRRSLRKKTYFGEGLPVLLRHI